jgi:hypothetical protein
MKWNGTIPSNFPFHPIWGGSNGMGLYNLHITLLKIALLAPQKSENTLEFGPRWFGFYLPKSKLNTSSDFNF